MWSIGGSGLGIGIRKPNCRFVSMRFVKGNKPRLAEPTGEAAMQAWLSAAAQQGGTNAAKALTFKRSWKSGISHAVYKYLNVSHYSKLLNNVRIDVVPNKTPVYAGFCPKMPVYLLENVKL